MTSTTEPGNGNILKQDALGRVRTPRAQRDLILAQFKTSGMSGVAFAAHVGVKYPTFASWVNKRRQGAGEFSDPPEGRSAQAVTASCQWIEMVAESADGAGMLAVQLPGGARMEVRDNPGAALAAELLTKLRKLTGGHGC